MSSITLPEHPMKDASGHGSSEKQAALEEACQKQLKPLPKLAVG
jgi:hypothetical protein